jgi:tRNA(Arg) A34 adenosine deaminase TadA
MDKGFFQQAIDVAKTSPSKKKVGCLLLNRGKVVQVATNLERKSHPIQAKFAKRVGLGEKIFLHAEISALIKCRQNSDAIVVARVNPQGKLRMAKPCPICELAIRESGIREVYYSTNNGFCFQQF